jgi:hypothetical protein
MCLFFQKRVRLKTYTNIVMFEKLFAWCGLHRPGKEDNKDGGSSNNHNDHNTNINNDDNVSDIGSEASSMISVEEIDPKTGQPVRVLKKKRSLIGRAYRKVTKTRSGKKKNGVEGVSGGDADLASASA